MLRRFKATDFRCLEDASLNLESQYSLIVGPNASGKTSLLEALAYLGRGKSFRGAQTSDVIRHGCNELVVFGEVERGGRTLTVGAGNSRDGLKVRVDGESRSGASALAEALPLQVIDPEIHNLVSGGPDGRRRFIDWVAFHVEHDFLSIWRSFRRSLKQRNAALRASANAEVLRGWDKEFVEVSLALDAARRSALEKMLPQLTVHGEGLLNTDLHFVYQQGWSKEHGLGESLALGNERERQTGSTQHGPHRADIRVSYDERQARRMVSRGQQKLLASAMILAATEAAQRSIGRPLLLLLDDPAAELDSQSVCRLINSVAGTGCQVVATSLNESAFQFPQDPALFHVKQGSVTAAQ